MSIHATNLHRLYWALTIFIGIGRSSQTTLLVDIPSQLQRLLQMEEETLKDTEHHVPTASDSEDSGQDDASSDEGLDLLLEDIACNTRCLLEASPLILRCIDRLQRPITPSLPAAGFSISGPASVYARLVRDRFPKASLQLVERLGEANWQRLEELRRKEALGSVATDAKPPQTFRDSGYESKNTTSSPYAASVISGKSHSSFKTTDTIEPAGRLSVPPAPYEVMNGSGRCPYCWQVQQNITDRIAWK